jgi:hypothetical protein
MDREYIGDMLGNCWENVGNMLGYHRLPWIMIYFIMLFWGIVALMFDIPISYHFLSWKFCRWCKLLVWLHGYMVTKCLKPYRKVRSLQRFLVSIKLCDDIKLFLKICSSICLRLVWKNIPTIASAILATKTRQPVDSAPL